MYVKPELMTHKNLIQAWQGGFSFMSRLNSLAATMSSFKVQFHSKRKATLIFLISAFHYSACSSVLFWGHKSIHTDTISSQMVFNEKHRSPLTISSHQLKNCNSGRSRITIKASGNSCLQLVKGKRDTNKVVYSVEICWVSFFCLKAADRPGWTCVPWLHVFDPQARKRKDRLRESERVESPADHTWWNPIF